MDWPTAEQWMRAGSYWAGTGPQYDASQVASRRQEEEAKLAREQAMARDVRTMRFHMLNGDKESLRTLIGNRWETIETLGGDASHTEALAGMLNSGDDEKLMKTLDGWDQLAVSHGLLDAENANESPTQFGSTKTFKDADNNLYFGSTARDPNTGTMKTLLSPIGPAPEYAGAPLQMVEEYGETSGERVTRAGATSNISRKGQLEADFDLLPQVAARVATAEAEVGRTFARAEETRTNEAALNAYNVAFGNLADSLGQTVTGPIAGLMPAITSNQQIAKGAVAVMQPVLKSLFRSAGEGVFTDKDQQILSDMIPTRSTSEKARAAQLIAIDALVRARLKGSKVDMQDVLYTAQKNQVSVTEVLQRVSQQGQ